MSWFAVQESLIRTRLARRLLPPSKTFRVDFSPIEHGAYNSTKCLSPVRGLGNPRIMFVNFGFLLKYGYEESVVEEISTVYNKMVATMSDAGCTFGEITKIIREHKLDYEAEMHEAELNGCSFRLRVYYTRAFDFYKKVCQIAYGAEATLREFELYRDGIDTQMEDVRAIYARLLDDHGLVATDNPLDDESKGLELAPRHDSPSTADTTEKPIFS